MSRLVLVGALFCAALFAAGQMLYKLTAMRWVEEGTWLSLRVLTPFVAAIMVYGGTSVAWITMMRRTDLSKVYPFSAVVYVLVPMGAIFFFREAVGPAYWIGAGLIIAGIAVIGTIS